MFSFMMVLSTKDKLVQYRPSAFLKEFIFAFREFNCHFFNRHNHVIQKLDIIELTWINSFVCHYFCMILHLPFLKYPPAVSIHRTIPHPAIINSRILSFPEGELCYALIILKEFPYHPIYLSV